MKWVVVLFVFLAVAEASPIKEEKKIAKSSNTAKVTENSAESNASASASMNKRSVDLEKVQKLLGVIMEKDHPKKEEPSVPVTPAVETKKVEEPLTDPVPSTEKNILPGLAKDATAQRDDRDIHLCKSLDRDDIKTTITIAVKDAIKKVFVKVSKRSIIQSSKAIGATAAAVGHIDAGNKKTPGSLIQKSEAKSDALDGVAISTGSVTIGGGDDDQEEKPELPPVTPSSTLIKPELSTLAPALTGSPLPTTNTEAALTKAKRSIIQTSKSEGKDTSISVGKIEVNSDTLESKKKRSIIQSSVANGKIAISTGEIVMTSNKKPVAKPLPLPAPTPVPMTPSPLPVPTSTQLPEPSPSLKTSVDSPNAAAPLPVSEPASLQPSPVLVPVTESAIMEPAPTQSEVVPESAQKTVMVSSPTSKDNVVLLSTPSSKETRDLDEKCKSALNDRLEMYIQQAVDEALTKALKEE